MSERLRKLQRAIKKAGCRWFFVTNLTNIRYLTGFSVTAGYLLAGETECFLFLDQRYSEMASGRAEKGLTILDPKQLGTKMSACLRLGFEADDVTVERYVGWKRKLKNTKFVQYSGFIDGLRRQKDSEELDAVKAASGITRKVLAAIPSMLRYGMTERELAGRISAACKKLGADDMAFESIVGFGEHTSRPHHRPTDRKLRKGDIVQIDMGAKLHGYCSDFSRVYFTADPSAEVKKAYRALKEAKKSAESLLRPGISIHRLDKTARAVLLKYGYKDEFCHALGHGVGLDIHEGVVLSTKRPDAKLLRNEVVTLEPGLYFPGKFGLRIEDTYIVA